jgi:V-type H+-transporting ATPase subunit A
MLSETLSLASPPQPPSPPLRAAYSKYMRVLGPFFDVIDADFSALREIARDLLQQEKDLSEIVQLVGRDSLSEDQKVVLELAKIIREDYLQQNAFSEHDFNCPLTKSVGMLRVIVQLYRRALKAVTGSDATGAAAATAAGAKTITWNVIKATQSKLINRVTVSVKRASLVSLRWL